MFLLRLILLTLLGDSIKVWGRMQFINPPPFGNGDTSQNVVYAAGSTVNLRWTEGTPDKATSMTMFQLNATQFMPDFEYITRM